MTENVQDGVEGAVRFISVIWGVKKAVNCFPAVTLVATEAGCRAIETIRKGDQVWACDLATNSWHLHPVIEPMNHLRHGDIIRVNVGDETIEATGDHPFWVIEGDNLETRPEPAHVASTEPGAIVPGRWVDARDLRPEDRLLRKSDRPVRVFNVVAEIPTQIVYNICVAELHTYAVGETRILVHNKSAPNNTRLGDLTPPEVQQIQSVVDKAGRPLEVVGSAANGTRRGVGTDLPIGKVGGTRSDIDYLVSPGSAPYYGKLQGKLPSIDPNGGMVPGTHNPYMGPGIRFEPDAPPTFIPKKD